MSKKRKLSKSDRVCFLMDVLNAAGLLSELDAALDLIKRDPCAIDDSSIYHYIMYGDDETHHPHRIVADILVATAA